MAYAVEWPICKSGITNVSKEREQRLPIFKDISDKNTIRLSFSFTLYNKMCRIWEPHMTQRVNISYKTNFWCPVMHEWRIYWNAGSIIDFLIKRENWFGFKFHDASNFYKTATGCHLIYIKTCYQNHVYQTYQNNVYQNQLTRRIY